MLTLQDYTGQQDYTGLYKTMLDYDYTELDYTRLYRIKPNNKGQFRTVQDYTELYGTIMDYTKFCRTIQDYIGLYRT